MWQIKPWNTDNPSLYFNRGTREAWVKGTKDMNDITERLLTITGQGTEDDLIKREFCQCEIWCWNLSPNTELIHQRSLAFTPDYVSYPFLEAKLLLFRRRQKKKVLASIYHTFPPFNLHHVLWSPALSWYLKLTEKSFPQIGYLIMCSLPQQFQGGNYDFYACYSALQYQAKSVSVLPLLLGILFFFLVYMIDYY